MAPEHSAADLLRRAGIDEREDDQGPPAGQIERRSEHGGGDIERGFGRVAAVWIAGATILAGFIGVSSWVTSVESKAAAAEAHTALTLRLDAQDKRDDAQDQQIAEVKSRLDSIDKNGARTLMLQLRAAKRSLEDDLRKLPPDSPGRENLERQLDEVNTDLRQQLRGP